MKFGSKNSPNDDKVIGDKSDAISEFKTNSNNFWFLESLLVKFRNAF